MNNREYIVHCYSCGVVSLGVEEYHRQLSKPDSLWYCPNCARPAAWVGRFDPCINPLCDGWVNIEDEFVCPKCGQNQME